MIEYTWCAIQSVSLNYESVQLLYIYIHILQIFINVVLYTANTFEIIFKGSFSWCIVLVHILEWKITSATSKEKLNWRYKTLRLVRRIENGEVNRIYLWFVKGTCQDDQFWGSQRLNDWFLVKRFNSAFSFGGKLPMSIKENW